MTALPDGVSIKKEGEMRFVSQRGYFVDKYCEGHFVSCMLAALCSVLEYMGYELPLTRLEAETPPENFVYSLHEATGSSLTNGTSIFDTKVALSKLLPDAPVKFAKGTSQEVLALVDNGAAIRFSIRCPQLPLHLRRFVGVGYKGRHAIAVVDHKIVDGEDMVLWYDPMARPVETWQGEWVKWNDVLPAFSDKDGNVIVTFGYKNAVVPVVVPEPPPIDGIPDEGTGDTEVILSNVVEHSRGTVGASTPILHPVTLEQVLLVGPTEVKLVGISPDGKYRGVLVRSRKIAGTNPKVALVDATLVTNMRIDDPCVDVKAELDKANADLATANENATADVAAAQGIVERHG